MIVDKSPPNLFANRGEEMIDRFPVGSGGDLFGKIEEGVQEGVVGRIKERGMEFAVKNRTLPIARGFPMLFDVSGEAPDIDFFGPSRGKPGGFRFDRTANLEDIDEALPVASRKVVEYAVCKTGFLLPVAVGSQEGPSFIGKQVPTEPFPDDETPVLQITKDDPDRCHAQARLGKNLTPDRPCADRRTGSFDTL